MIKPKKILAAIVAYIVLSLTIWSSVISTSEISESAIWPYLGASFVLSLLLIIVATILNWCIEVLIK